MVNVDKLKLFEPSILDDEPYEVLPKVEDFAADSKSKLVEDTIVVRKNPNTRHRRGNLESFRIGRKGQTKLGKMGLTRGWPSPVSTSSILELAGVGCPNRGSHDLGRSLWTLGLPRVTSISASHQQN